MNFFSRISEEKRYPPLDLLKLHTKMKNDLTSICRVSINEKMKKFLLDRYETPKKKKNRRGSKKYKKGKRKISFSSGIKLIRSELGMKKKRKKNNESESSDEEDENDNKKKKNVWKKKNLKRWLISFQNPEKSFLFYKKMIVFICCLINVFCISFRCVFFLKIENFLKYLYMVIMLMIFDILYDMIYIIDMVLLCFTPFYSQIDGLLRTDYKTIIKSYINYKGGRFLLDVISIVPFDYVYFIIVVIITVFFYQGDYMIFISYLRFVPFFRINRCIKTISKYFHFFNFFESHSTVLRVTPGYIRIFKYFLLLIITSHVLACFWYIIIMYEENPKTILRTEIKDFNEKTIFGIFLYDFHWVFVLITGYGGTIPASFIQVFYSGFIVLVGIIINISIIGIVSSIVRDLLSEGSSQRQNFEKVKLYIQYKGIKEKLKKRILSYYLFAFQNRRQWDEKVIIQNLPMYLRTELSIQINSKIIKKVALFKTASKQFISAVVLKLTPRVVLPHQIIIKAGDVGREMYFLTKGKVNVLSVKNAVLATLNEGTFFGEIALIRKTTRNATVKSVTFCDLYMLTKESFELLEKDFPKEVDLIISEANKRSKIKEKKKQPKKKIEKKKRGVLDLLTNNVGGNKFTKSLVAAMKKMKGRTDSKGRLKEKSKKKKSFKKLLLGRKKSIKKPFLPKTVDDKRNSVVPTRSKMMKIIDKKRKSIAYNVKAKPIKKSTAVEKMKKGIKCEIRDSAELVVKSKKQKGLKNLVNKNIHRIKKDGMRSSSLQNIPRNESSKKPIVKQRRHKTLQTIKKQIY